jgi:LPS-assembly protein
MLRCFLTVLFATLALADVTPAAAQVAPAPPPPAVQTPQSQIGGCKVSEMQGATQEVLSKEFEGKTERVLVLTGTGALAVRVDCDDMQFFAEFVEIYQDRNRVVATGNVTFVNVGSRISAERMEFDTKTKTGVFYEASGWATLSEKVERSMFGTQEPDAQFRGKEIHKLGPKKYKIVNGAFSTCVQPTPRWEIVSGSATLNLDDYALLKNSVFRVKGVPLMYMPLFYYPIDEDDRSTGFLIPIYGSSTRMGQTWSFPFFWAINRSQDATVEYDWSSKAGRIIGGEYRYVLGPGARGQLTTSLFDQKTQAAGATTTAGERSYRVDGSLVQPLGHGLRAQANADYFSSLATEQTYQQDVYRATQSRRNFGGNISGNWREYVLSATMFRNDTFLTSDLVATDGGLPRITFNRGERRIGKSPFYFGVGSEFDTILRRQTLDGETVPNTDQGLSRIDVSPGLRIPFTRWPFLSVNSTVGWRGTYWTESIENGAQVNESIGRSYFDLATRITGPVFSRIFSSSSTDPDARKIKHVIEPTFTVRRTTAIDNFDKIVKLDGVDYVYGDTFEVGYGLNNRIYSKRKVAREVVTVALTQSYYTNAQAAQYDPGYQNNFTLRRPSNYSPIRLSGRVYPSDHFLTDTRMEWDPSGPLLLISANAAVNTTHVQSVAGWTQQRVLPQEIAKDPVTTLHYLNSSTTFRTASNHLGATYAFNYDLLRDTFLQQRYFVYYNAQCCGVLVEYQIWNYSLATIPQDKRFNVSFTLAGIGTFSNFLGAFGAKTGR